MNTLQILVATEKRLSNAIAEIVVLREKLAAKDRVIEAARDAANTRNTVAWALATNELRKRIAELDGQS